MKHKNRHSYDTGAKEAQRPPSQRNLTGEKHPHRRLNPVHVAAAPNIVIVSHVEVKRLLAGAPEGCVPGIKDRELTLNRVSVKQATGVLPDAVVNGLVAPQLL